MGLLSSLFSATKYLTFFAPRDFRFNDEVNNSFNPDSDIISTLLTCEKILADQLAKLPLEVYRSDDEKGKLKDKKHGLYRLLHSTPNNFQSSTLFIQQLERWRNRYGNSFARIRRKLGSPVSLELVHPKRVVGFEIVEGFLFYFLSKGTGQPERVSSDDILHFRFISEDGIWGMDPVNSVFRELDNIYQGRTTLNSTYKNQLNVDKYFKTSVTNFAAKNAKENIDEVKKEYSGAKNSGKSPFLPSGFELVPIQKSSIQDAQILESMNFSKRDIVALYGLPFHFFFDGQSYNSIEQQTLNFKTNTLQPIARMYRQEFERKLLTDTDFQEDVSIEFNLNAVVEVDMKTRIDYLSKLRTMGVVSANTVAKMEGFETYEGGDLHFIQSQNIPVEEYEKYAKIAQSQPNTNNPNPDNNATED